MVQNILKTRLLTTLKSDLCVIIIVNSKFDKLMILSHLFLFKRFIHVSDLFQRGCESTTSFSLQLFLWGTYFRDFFVLLVSDYIVVCREFKKSKGNYRKCKNKVRDLSEASKRFFFSPIKRQKIYIENFLTAYLSISWIVYTWWVNGELLYCVLYSVTLVAGAKNISSTLHCRREDGDSMLL